MTEEQLVINPRERGLIRLDFRELFGNDGAVTLEIGSGKGRFLIASAMERPDVNFIGIEKHEPYYEMAAQRLGY